ncbi:MAG: hypothetical protein HQ465_02800 [Rhodospirillales bacterium]|nr:hypothetical protein [Rhodospirillales bacterium]
MIEVFETVLALQLQLQGLLSQRFAELFSTPATFASGMLVAAGLGLVHALTPGHGKAVIFSHFLGQSGSILAGLRVAGLAALTHGTIAVLLVLTAGRVISPLGRPTGAGAWVEVVAGAIVASVGAVYVVLALRGLKWGGTASHGHGHGHVQEKSQASRSMLAIAMGLLPCPLTIIVVGSAVAHGATGAGVALAAGVSIGAAITIASFGLLGIALRRAGVAAASGRVRGLIRALGWLELLTALLILLLGVGMLAGSWARVPWR